MSYKDWLGTSLSLSGKRRKTPKGPTGQNGEFSWVKSTE